MYSMGQTELQMSSVEKDLGVFVDDRLNFKKHVSHAVNKASRILRMMPATFSCPHEDTRVTIVQSAGKTTPRIWQHYLASLLSSRQA